MKKEIDADKVALMLFPIETLGGLETALGELFDKLPEKVGGVALDRDGFITDGVALYFASVKPFIESKLKGQLPDVSEIEPEEPEEPELVLESNFIQIENAGATMSWNSEPYDKFVFPKCGPEYTSKSFQLVFSDGNMLMVPDPKQMRMTPDNMKYQPGGRWSHNNPDIPTMEVYARKDTHPDWVKAVFRHNVDTTPVEPTEPTEPDTGWTRIVWGGKDPDPDHNRVWWS